MVPPALAIAGFLCVLAASAYLLVRHVYLAVLTVAAPVCVFAILLILPSARHGLDMDVAMFLASICVLFVCDLAARSICTGAAPRAAVSSSLKEVAAAAGPILAAYVLALLLLAPKTMTLSDRAGGAATVAVACASCLVLGIAAILVPFSEDDIARLNIVRERRERMFERWSFVAETRWSLSIAGMGFILASLAVFGARDTHVAFGWRGVAEIAASAVLIASAFAAIARNWRLGLAATLAACLIAVLQLWMLMRVEAEWAAPLYLWFAIVPELVAMCVFVHRLSRYVNRDGDPAMATVVTLRELGSATATAYLVLAAAAFVETVRSDEGALVYFVAPAAGLAATLLFFPAFANAIYWLMPRYRSVEEIFGRR